MDNQLVVPPKNEITVSSSIPSQHEMMVYHTMAEQAITSKLYGNNYKDKSAVMMIMLSARELGIPPMQALNGGLNLIQGKVEISARMMSALIRKAGHRLVVKENTNTHCILVGTRADTGESQSASFSVAEAQQAGLVKPGGGWTKWPKDMCFARALSRLARQLFSDVIGIGYVEGEIVAQEAPIQLENVLEPEPVVNEDELKKNYLAIFSSEDQEKAKEYLEVVKNHFSYDTIQALNMLTGNIEYLLSKFKHWKENSSK